MATIRKLRECWQAQVRRRGMKPFDVDYGLPRIASLKVDDFRSREGLHFFHSGH